VKPRRPWRTAIVCALPLVVAAGIARPGTGVPAPRAGETSASAGASGEEPLLWTAVSPASAPDEPAAAAARGNWQATR